MFIKADLLFVSYVTIGNRTFKYIFVVVDVASRYMDAEPYRKKMHLVLKKHLK